MLPLYGEDAGPGSSAELCDAYEDGAYFPGPHPGQHRPQPLPPNRQKPLILALSPISQVLESPQWLQRLPVSPCLKNCVYPNRQKHSCKRRLLHLLLPHLHFLSIQLKTLKHNRPHPSSLSPRAALP